jgi:hypothetical protein
MEEPERMHGPAADLHAFDDLMAVIPGSGRAAAGGDSSAKGALSSLQSSRS